jgi:hypothetical protein
VTDNLFEDTIGVLHHLLSTSLLLPADQETFRDALEILQEEYTALNIKLYDARERVYNLRGHVDDIDKLATQALEGSADATETLRIVCMKCYYSESDYEPPDFELPDRPSEPGADGELQDHAEN